jgi:chaperonin cofactor prefoldin
MIKKKIEKLERRMAELEKKIYEKFQKNCRNQTLLNPAEAGT